MPVLKSSHTHVSFPGHLPTVRGRWIAALRRRAAFGHLGSGLLINGQNLLDDKQSATSEMTKAGPELTPPRRSPFFASDKTPTESSSELHVAAFANPIVKTMKHRIVNQ